MGKQGGLPARRPRLGGRKQHPSTQALSAPAEQPKQPTPHVEGADDQHDDTDDQYEVDNTEDVQMTDPVSPRSSVEDIGHGESPGVVEQPVLIEGSDNIDVMQGVEWSDMMGPSQPPWTGGSGSEPETDSDEDELVDIEQLREDDLEDIAAQADRLGVQLDDMLGAGGYEDCIVVAVEPEPFDEINPVIEEGEEEEAPTPVVPPAEDDISRLVPIRQNKFIEMSEFEFALAILADLLGLSRTTWTSLRETLHLIRDEEGRIPQAIQRLPPQLSTLLKNMRNRMPMMDMREAEIPLDILKMPTLPPNLKDEERRKIEAMRIRAQRKKAANAAKKGEGRTAVRARAKLEKLKDKDTSDAELDIPLPIQTTTLTFFDPLTLFRNLAASDIAKRAHSGPGHFVDMPREFFESQAWLSSVRSTSGRYAHIILDLDDDVKGPAIFPGDWVHYRCTKPPNQCALACNDIPNERVHVKAHIGRVYSVGFDYRKSPCTTEKDRLCLQIHEAHRRGAAALEGFDIPEDKRELILSSKPTYIPETKVYSHVEAGVYVDQHFAEDHTDPSAPIIKPRLGKAPKPRPTFPKYSNPVFSTGWDKDAEYYMVRRMVDRPTGKIVPMCHTHPIRAELECNHWSRDHFLEWDKDREGAVPVMSFPHIDFIDGFGVFRNSYRTLMGFYFTPAGLLLEERIKPRSIFPLLLGPHGSDLRDITKALKTMTQLDEGVIMDIGGKGKVRLCAFTMCYTGDMPQQAENTGFKGPRGIKFCRCCFTSSALGKVTRDPDAQINFDIVTHGRYHPQISEMQQYMASLNDSNALKYGTQWGINEPFPALSRLSPALDIVLSRPPDAAHSEFNGISNLAHTLLTKLILTPAAKAEYTVQLRSWPYPPGWQRFQSVFYHLKSFKISDHGRWLVIIPTLLMHWLKKDHINPRFYAKAQEAMGPDRDPVEFIVETMAKLAKSASLLMGVKPPKKDRRKMPELIFEARHMFNQLHVFASAATASSAVTSAAGTPIGTPVLDADIVDAADAAQGQAGDGDAFAGGLDNSKSMGYFNDALRPNVHIAMHYPVFAKEYGLPVNCNTLTGEDMHRYWKERVYETNYSNIEKVLLMKMNMQQTLRLVVLNAFQHEDGDPELTARITGLRDKCPTLFDRVLSHSDQAEIDESQRLLESELEVGQSADNDHLSPGIINKITGTYVVAEHVANEGQRLPRVSTLDEMTARWTKLLRQAYHYDYGTRAGYPEFFETRHIQWAEKFGFTDRASNKRYKFKCGDYIQYFSRGNKEFRFGRVDHVFMQHHMNAKHIFALITPVNRTNTRHHILDLEIMEEAEDDPVIIGITAVQPKSVYMVRVDGVGIVWVNWDVHTL